MDLTAQLENELKQLVGFSASAPRRVEMTSPAGLVLSVDFLAVDKMSCSLESLTLQVPALVGREVCVLNQWAENLSRRVPYLLESIAPIEIDDSGHQVLIRSNPPDLSQGATQFYEVLLSAQANGTFLLKRYRTESGQPGRESVDILLTNQTLKKLVNDLVDTIPETN